MRTYTRRRPVGQLIEDVRNLCRLCLEKSEEMTPIFIDGSDSIRGTLSLRIMICVGLEVTKEECLPNIICSNCLKELDGYYKFRKKCEVSYQRLKLHLLAVKDKECLHQVVGRSKDQEMHIQDNVDCNKSLMKKNIFSDWNFNGLGNSEISIDVQENNMNMEEVNQIGNNKIEISIEPHEHSNVKKEIETQIHDADNPEISSFLSTVLIQLGILDQQGSTLSVLDHGINNLELVMGNDDQVTLELMEEDDSADESEVPSIYKKMEPIVLNGIAGGGGKSEGNNTSDNIEEQIMTIKWKPESISESNSGVGGGAWCGVCHKRFATRGSMLRHARAHSGSRPHACAECGRRFAQRAVLERHRLLHLARRPFSCTSCGAGFTQRAALESHVRSHAAPPARALHLHACTRCPKVFLYSSSLSRHMMQHNGRVYECMVCKRPFSDQSSFLRHMRRTHALPPEQPHQQHQQHPRDPQHDADTHPPSETEHSGFKIHQPKLETKEVKVEMSAPDEIN